MKGLDLSKKEDQLKLLWIPQFPDRKVFVGGRQDDRHAYRIRPENLTCLVGGSHHEWEHWGRDVANHGLAGIVEVDVHVCTDCGRDKR